MPAWQGARRTNVATALPLAVRAPRALRRRSPGSPVAAGSLRTLKVLMRAAVCDAQVQECETECPCAAAAGREGGASVCSAASFVLEGASARRSARVALPLADVLPCRPRLAPSPDLIDAVTLFQALHMCKSDEGVVSTGKTALDAPKISAAVAACWHRLTSPTQQARMWESLCCACTPTKIY